MQLPTRRWQAASVPLAAALELWASGELSWLAVLILRLAIRGYARGWIGRATFHRCVARAALWHMRAHRDQGLPTAAGRTSRTETVD